MNSSILSPAGRLVVTGLVAMTILAARLQGQYVSTIISNGLHEPYGVAADPSGNVYIADAVNNRIAEYVPGTGILSTFAGQDGPSYAGTNNGTGTAARFNQPQGIVYAPGRGGLVVVDQNNQELRFVSLTGVVSNLAGKTSVIGFSNAIGTNAQFSYPTGIAVANDQATLYIADQGNNAIRMVSYPSNVVSTIATNYTYNSVTNTFHSPAAVAVDSQSNVWVTDSSDQVICMITNNGVAWVAQGIVGTYRTTGANDSSALTGAQFNQPSGLLWDGQHNLLVISDTANDTIRSLFLTNIQGVSSYYVQTISGIAGVPGLVDGALAVGEFNHPFGLCIDATDSGYYVADGNNNALRVVQAFQAPPPPMPVTNPVLGFVTFPLVNGTPSATFNPFTSPITLFNNDADIAIEQDDGTVATYYTWGATGSVPAPTTNSSTATVFTASELGLPMNQVQSLVISELPDLTLIALSAAPGRPSSATVSARIEFVTANPTIIGNNAASVIFNDITAGAQMLYTIDGNPPTNGAADTFGPVSSGATVSFTITTNTTLSVQAIKPTYAPSGVVTATFSPTNFSADEITLGFESGEASSKFITAPGQTFIAPVTMTLISTAEIMYSLQFNLAISNVTAPAVPTVGPDALTFSSMLEEPIPGTTPPIYVPIPPAMVTSGGFTNLLFTNVDLLGVGWLERKGETNLYDTTQQTLISFSQAHDTVFLNTGDRVVVGGFSFKVPTTALVGQTYEIQVGSPSATSDGISTPVSIVTVTNGSLTNGAVNSTKIVTVGSAHYLVGDVAPFLWFNAGDFGDSTLQNNDVTETFQTAVYGFDGPNTATKNSDYFDAMDSSDGMTNTLYMGTDTSINSIQYGDGMIAVDDVFVTYRRSLDPSLTWYDRYDTASGKMAVPVSNGLSQPFSGAAAGSAQVAASPYRYITVAADQVNSGGNLSVQVPVRVLAGDVATNPLPVTVMMLRVEIDPLDGSPPVTSQIVFSGVTNLGPVFDTASQGPNDFAAAWLNSTYSGVAGAGMLGSVFVTLPSNVTSNSAYRVHFDHFSASPNGLALFHATVQDGLITVGDRSGSSWKDGIPDSWRLLNFGAVSNALSAANADPDGDGASNWAEYVAGTNPNDVTSVFKFMPSGSLSASSFSLQWSSAVNKHYTVQCCYGIAPGNWKTIATNILGNGQIMQWTDTNATGKSEFYRALVQ